MTHTSLQQRIDAAGGALAMLRTSQTGPYAFPIPAEFTNWRDEQRAWREGVALVDQSHHMTDLYVEGPDVLRLVSELAVNSFTGFGDMIIFGLGNRQVNIVGRPTVANWVQFKAKTGGYDVMVDRDERTLNNPKPRKTFRFEIQGPDAWRLLEKPNGGSKRPNVERHVQTQVRATVSGWPFSSLAQRGCRPS